MKMMTVNWEKFMTLHSSGKTSQNCMTGTIAHDIQLVQ